MRRSFLMGGVLAVLSLAPAATARVAPLTPEQQAIMERHNALENAVRERFSDGTFNQLRDMYASIIVAEERRGRPQLQRVLLKDEHGWQELRTDGRRKLPRRIAHELDRLLLNPDLFAEVPNAQDGRCAEPQLFILRYAGHQLFGRQCTAAGLSGRAARIAADLRIPGGRGVTTAPPPGPNDARASLGALEDMTDIVSNRAREMVYAWERRSLAGAVDPYADDVIVEFPDGRTLRGRAALVEWIRPQQAWSTPGLATRGATRGIQYQRGTIKAPHNGIITEFREVRWNADGRAMRRTYSANWRNNGGVWQIVHERVSADKPVTDERIAWP